LSKKTGWFVSIQDALSDTLNHEKGTFLMVDQFYQRQFFNIMRLKPEFP